MKTRMLLAVAFAAAAMLISQGLRAEDAKEPKLDGIKCPITGKAVVADKSAEYMGGKVYFCCGNCLAKFKEDPSKFEAKAKAQMMETGQLKQVACPISGKPVSADKTLDVAGVKVAFCCNNCKAKVEKATPDEQLNLVFGKDAKTFVVK